MVRLAPLSAPDLARGLDDQVQLIDTFSHGEPEDSRTRARRQREKNDIDRFCKSAVKPQLRDPKRADSRKCRITAKPSDIAPFGQNPAFSLVKTFDFETGSDVLNAADAIYGALRFDAMACWHSHLWLCGYLCNVVAHQFVPLWDDSVAARRNQASPSMQPVVSSCE
jgi:hypothetical protein